MKFHLLIYILCMIVGTLPSHALYIPEENGIYMIGEFNNWQVPDENGTHGAVQMTKLTDKWETYEKKDFNFPEGDSNFTFIRFTKGNSTPSYVVGLDDSMNMQLRDFSSVPEKPEDWYRPYEHYRNDSDKVLGGMGRIMWLLYLDKQHSCRLKNWIGGNVNILLDSQGAVYLSAQEMPLYEPVTNDNKIYAIVSIDDSDPQIMEMDFFRSTITYTITQGRYGKKFRFILTTELSTDPNLANCWGLPEKRIIKQSDLENKPHKTFALNFVRGGEPVEIDLLYQKGFELTYDWLSNKGILEINYLVSLRSVSAIINVDGLEKTIDCPINPQTCFTDEIEISGKEVSIKFIVEDLEGHKFHYGPATEEWNKLHSHMTYPEEPYYKENIFNNDNAFYGSFKDYGTIRVRISPQYGLCYYQYEENGKLTDGILDMPIDMDENDESLNPEKMLYYDLNGRPVENPRKGLYIRKTGDKFEKIMIP